MQKYKIDQNKILLIIDNALDEDLAGVGDITSNLTIPQNSKIKFQIVGREEIVLCGVDIALMVFDRAAQILGLEPLKIKKHFNDGKLLPKNNVIISGSGNAKLIFAAERVALNLIQHLSGIASETKKYVDEIVGEKTKILDTRKTILGLRILQKYAVVVGGGSNHRMGLYDAVLIKDNHIAAARGIKNAVLATKKSKMKIEVECDNLDQVGEAVEAGVDVIMLDNMNLEQIKKAAKLIGKKAKIEVSGGINLKQINAISKIGVDYISVGALTHSVKAVDIGLDIVDL
jgi:nicotinate-nucleotide pyrophosphorylase (carboxylating)